MSSGKLFRNILYAKQLVNRKFKKKEDLLEWALISLHKEKRIE